MRRLALGLLVFLALGAPAAAAGKQRPCFPRGSKTVIADAGGRVFYLPRDEEYYGCLYKIGRPRQLPDDFDDLGTIKLRSPFVVYVGYTASSGNVFMKLNRYDLRSGTWRQLDDFGNFSDHAVLLEDLAFTRSGNVGWTLATYDDPPGQVTRTVQKFDDSGKAMLDPGPTVDRGSLAMTGSGRRLYWTNAGEPRTALLR